MTQVTQVTAFLDTDGDLYLTREEAERAELRKTLEAAIINTEPSLAPETVIRLAKHLLARHDLYIALLPLPKEPF